jgi:hypothetical protein
MTTESLLKAVKRELPELLRSDPDLCAYILELTRQEYAGRAETQDRFYETLAELYKDRENQARRWDENQEQLRRFPEKPVVPKWLDSIKVALAQGQQPPINLP